MLLALRKEGELTAELQDLINDKLAGLGLGETPELQVEAPAAAPAENATEERVEKPHAEHRGRDRRVEQEPAEIHEAPAYKEAPVFNDSAFYNLEDDEEDRAFTRHKNSQHNHGRHGAKRLPVFSLNDRFLFMREIFDDDAAVFNTALNRVASYRSFAEALDYLIGECGLNPDESETDERFVGIIKDYFDSRR